MRRDVDDVRCVVGHDGVEIFVAPRADSSQQQAIYFVPGHRTRTGNSRAGFVVLNAATSGAVNASCDPRMNERPIVPKMVPSTVSTGALVVSVVIAIALVAVIVSLF